MKIKFIKSVNLEGREVAAGQIIDIERAHACLFIKAGYALKTEESPQVIPVVEKRTE